MSLTKQLVFLGAVAVAAVAAVVVVDLSGMVDPGASGATPAPVRESETPAPVIVEPVRYSGGAAIVEAVGTGKATTAVTLHPESAGRVTEVLFRAGRQVEQGDPLLRLDAAEEKLNVELARVQLEDARQQLARYEKTAPTGAVSITEVDRARTALAAARIALAQAELALERRTLVAPFEGVVGIPQVDVGDRVTEATPIATLDNRKVLLVDFEVPEAFAYGVRVGGEVEASTWAVPGEKFVGVVQSVASRIDPQTRTLQVRARLDNPQDRLRTGMSFTIRLPLQGERFPSVPSVAVQWDRTGSYVWRVVGDHAERVQVKVLKREEEWVLVDAPLARGDQIVVEGVQRLRPGRLVEVKPREAVGEVTGRV